MATILVIEDQSPNANLTAFLLEKQGYDVVIAPTGELGIQHAIARQPDLIIMDVRLPGIDGIEATAALKNNSLTTHIPIIALSSNMNEETKIAAISAGCETYLTKPVNFRDFWQLIQHLLKRQATAGQP